MVCQRSIAATTLGCASASGAIRIVPCAAANAGCRAPYASIATSHWGSSATSSSTKA